MLRQALQEFHVQTSNARLLRQKVEKFQMDRVCSRFSAILVEWRVVTVYRREVARRSRMLQSVRMQTMKKLCIRLLAKNASKIKAERQENQFVQLFYYESVLKRTFKAFVEHRDRSMGRKQFSKQTKQRLDASRKRRTLR